MCPRHALNNADKYVSLLLDAHQKFLRRSYYWKQQKKCQKYGEIKLNIVRKYTFCWAALIVVVDAMQDTEQIKSSKTPMSMAEEQQVAIKFQDVSLPGGNSLMGESS